MQFNNVVVATSYPGFWGKGVTVNEAVAHSEFIKNGDTVLFIRCNDDFLINEFGDFVCSTDYCVAGIGTIRKSKVDGYYVQMNLTK